MRFWANLVGYQLVWFAAVIGAGQGNVWSGVLAAGVFVVGQWTWSRQRAADARLIVVALLLGQVIEGSLARNGVVTFAAAWPSANFAPLWILAVWAAFAMTLNHSLGFLQGRTWLSAVFGAVGGPLAYLSAARGWGAVQFAEPMWRALAWLALAWAVAMPLLAHLAQRWTNDSRARALLEGAPSQ